MNRTIRILPHDPGDIEEMYEFLVMVLKDNNFEFRLWIEGEQNG